MVNILTTQKIIDFIKKNYKSIRQDKIDLNCESSSDEDSGNVIKPLQYLKTERITSLSRELDQWLELKKVKYYHTGCLKNFEPINIDYDINISLFSSVLTCLLPVFSQPTAKLTQSDIVQQLILKLKKYSKKKFIEFEYRNKESSLTYTDLINELDSGIFGGNIVRYLADYLHINIFIFDLEEDQLIFGNIKNFVPYKKSIFLIKFSDNIYEPITTNKLKYFSYDDNLVDVIITNIEDIDNDIVIMENEDIAKYNIKPVSISFSEKKALRDLKTKEYKASVIEKRKNEEASLIKLQEEQLKKNINESSSDETTTSEDSTDSE